MTGDFASIVLLPDEQKRELCLQLLEEFGAEAISENTRGELRHRCTLPLPGHTDHNSVTASINYRKLTWNCFVCGNSGGFLWWIAVNRQTTTGEAKAWLQKESGVSEIMDLPTMMKFLEALAYGGKDGHEPIPVFNDGVLAPWRQWPIQHPYLTEPIEKGGRGIPEANLERYEVGYCDEDTNWDYYQRIIIPLRWNKQLVGWQARRMWAGDPQTAKYLNSPGTPRDRILYGETNSRDRIVFVESPMSVLRHAHHLPVVASLGSSVTDLQVRLLHRYREIIFWFDNDKAGYRALLGSKSVPGLLAKLESYCTLRVVQSPYAQADPADLDEEEATALVASAVPYVLWSPPKEGELVDHVNSQEMAHVDT
jgi:hypothetical protein